MDLFSGQAVTIATISYTSSQLSHYGYPLTSGVLRLTSRTERVMQIISCLTATNKYNTERQWAQAVKENVCSSNLCQGIPLYGVQSYT